MGYMLLEPWVWFLIILLTVLGTAFSFLKYTVGRDGTEAILERYPQVGKDRLDRATGLFERHGSVILLFAAVPGLDTIVCAVAGAVDVGRVKFILWVTIAKLVRFWLLALILTGAVDLVSG